MRRRLATPALLAALAVTLSCDDPVGPPDPVPGWIAVTLATPADADAALVVRLTGPALPLPADVEGAPGATMFARPDGSGLRIAVFGDLADGLLFRFPVADTAGAAAYAATIAEVAAPDFTLREDLGAYVLTLSATVD